jgi:hypothetical protein
MASYRRRGRVWYYRFVDGDGIPREIAGCPDRRATEDIARKAETEAARIRRDRSTRGTRLSVYTRPDL